MHGKILNQKNKNIKTDLMTPVVFKIITAWNM